MLPEEWAGVYAPSRVRNTAVIAAGKIIGTGGRGSYQHELRHTGRSRGPRYRHNRRRNAYIGRVPGRSPRMAEIVEAIDNEQLQRRVAGALAAAGLRAGDRVVLAG